MLQHSWQYSPVWLLQKVSYQLTSIRAIIAGKLKSPMLTLTIKYLQLLNKYWINSFKLKMFKIIDFYNLFLLP